MLLQAATINAKAGYLVVYGERQIGFCVLSFLMLMLRLHTSLYGHIVLLSSVVAILGIAIFDANITIINSIVHSYLSLPLL